MTIIAAWYWMIAGILTLQSAFIVAFIMTMSRRLLKGDSQNQPKAAIILCLRGSDPFLESCLQNLLDQDYRDFRLHVVVDSASDDSWQVLRPLVDDPRVNVQTLDHPLETCSLKCSSLVQAVRSLDDDVEVVALCDADVVPHPQWLASLVAPMSDPKVGAVTGGRWYEPPQGSNGSLMRYLWNVAATINMVTLRIAWGGSVAIRKSAIDQASLLEKWSRAFCEDTMLYRQLRAQGLKQVFAPNVMMVNRESCSIKEFIRWSPRQMLTVRLYHPGWIHTAGYTLLSVIVPSLALSLGIWSAWRGNLHGVIAALAGIVVFESCIWMIILLCENTIQRRLRYEGVRTGGLRWGVILQMPPWILVSQLLGPYLFFKSAMMCEVDWRGVVYTITGRRITRKIE